jgi:AraC-like DNA-binding protein
LRLDGARPSGPGPVPQAGPATARPPVAGLSDDGDMDQGRLGGGAAPVNESVWACPAPALRPFIARYVGYRQAGVPPATHRGLPSPYLTVIFTLDDPLTLAGHPDPGQSPGSYRTLVGGLHTAPALITHPGRQSGLQLAVSPLGARALLGLPAGELASIDVEGSGVLGPLADRIAERLQAAGDWPARFAVLDRMLTSRLVTGPPGGAPDETGTEVRHAWRLLLASGGRCPVSGLAAETGWSDRHLRSRFRHETGLTPKAAARVIRFDRARRLLQQRAAAAGMTLPALADLAADCGYYDQAHLAREFRDLAGCPPSAWLAEELRIVQARPGTSRPGLAS